VDDAESSFHSGLRREALPPFAHRLEKNACSWMSLRVMGHLLQEETAQRKDTEVGSEVRHLSPDTSQQLVSMTIILNLETGQP
jgi:hypothetical protein